MKKKKGDRKLLRRDKRGAEMTIGTIIIIILALIVLVVIIYGFTQGWGNLWNAITNFGVTKSNVQKVIQGCQAACASNSVHDYCTLERNIRFEDTGDNKKIHKGTATCKKLEQGEVDPSDDGPSTVPGVQNLLDCDSIDCA